MYKFGSQLRACMSQYEITELELSEELGITQSELISFLLGDTLPSEDTLRKIAEYFDVLSTSVVYAYCEDILESDNFLGKSNQCKLLECIRCYLFMSIEEFVSLIGNYRDCVVVDDSTAENLWELFGLSFGEEYNLFTIGIDYFIVAGNTYAKRLSKAS